MTARSTSCPEMGRAIMGYGLGFGLMTLAGLFLSINEPMAHSLSQLDVFLILIRAYTPLLAPISSALGQPTIGGYPSPGLMPLLLWLAMGYLVGLLLTGPGAAAKATFLTSATIIVLWIGSLFLSAPAWQDQHTWLTMLSRFSQDLVSRPIDLAFILAAPTILSALTSQMIEMIRQRPIRSEELEERYALY